MNDDSSEEWVQEDLPEGFDVYDYDEKKARWGRIMVLSIFLLALIAFILAAYNSARMARPREPGVEYRGRA